MTRPGTWVLASVLLGFVFAEPAPARTFATPEQVLAQSFPGARLEKRTDYLSQPQSAAIEAAAGSPPRSKIVQSWRVCLQERELATAWLDAHLVRTLPETILVIVDPAGRVLRVEILSFDEPEEYLPRARWLEQFRGRSLDPELSIKTGIRGVTGATLSARAVTAAVRRVLAERRVLVAAAVRPDPGPPRAGTPPAAP